MKLTGDTTGLIKLELQKGTTLFIRPEKDLDKVKTFYKSLLKRENYPPKKLKEIVIVALPKE